MIATALSMLSKFLVFLGKWMSIMVKSWHHTFVSTKLTWQKLASDIYNLMRYGMTKMLVSLQ